MEMDWESDGAEEGKGAVTICGMEGDVRNEHSMQEKSDGRRTWQPSRLNTYTSSAIRGKGSIHGEDSGGLSDIVTRSI